MTDRQGLGGRLPANMINRLANIHYHSNFALVAIAGENGKDTIAAVGRYGKGPDEGGTDFAVAVRDNWQQAGFGKSMLRSNSPPQSLPQFLGEE